MNKCRIAWLIGPAARDGYLPTDPSEYGWSWRRVKVGCTNLRCSRCGEKIRSLAHAESAISPQDAGKIYAVPDLAAHPDVRPSASHKLYLCRCYSYEAASVEEAFDDHDYLHPTPRYHWDCGGHPPWELPAVLDGIAIHAGMDFPALVVRLPPDFWPAPLPPMKEVDLVGIWLARLWHLLSDLDMRQKLAAAASDLIADPEPAHRATALGFFEGCSDFATERLIAMLRGHLALFVGHPDPTRPGHALDERLLRLLEQIVPAEADLSPGATAALILQQELALTGRYHEAILYSIRRQGSAWICDHARELARVSPKWLDAVVDIVCDADEADAVPALASLAGDPSLDQGRLRSAVHEELDGLCNVPDAKLAAILAIFPER